MNDQEMRAYDWARRQNFRSVAADHARTLAQYIEKVGDIELHYPNWEAKFPTIAAAVRWHTNAQNEIIRNLRRRVAELSGEEV